MKKINKIKIKLNGKYIKIHDKITLINLIKKFKVPINKVAIELNRRISRVCSLYIGTEQTRCHRPEFRVFCTHQA